MEKIALMIALHAAQELVQTETNALQQNAHLDNIVMQLEETAKLLTLQVMYA